MRHTLEGILQRRPARRWVARAAATVVTGALCAFAPASALASSALKEEFAPFADCPVETAAVCMIATTTSGEFVIGHKTVPVEKTITLQGGLATGSFLAQPLIGALGGATLSDTPLTVPGGLVGIGGIGGEVTATAEIAGPPSSVIVNKGNLLAQSGTAVTLPLKVKLSNEILGEECYIGSEAEPIVLHLTTGATSPPFPYQSISGSRGTLEGKGKGKITGAKGTSLVDNDFSVPGASGCGGSDSAVIDLLVDLDVGIPSSVGQNTAIMNGGLEEAASEFVVKYKPKAKKAKKK